jgi:hypothetical protein
VVAREQDHGQADVGHGFDGAHDGATADVVGLEDLATHRNEAAVLVVRDGTQVTYGLDIRVGETPPSFFAQGAPRHSNRPLSRMEKPDQSDSPRCPEGARE